MEAIVREVRWEAQDVLSFRLESPCGGQLPAFTAGAHITVSVGPGVSRSYSLLNDPMDREAYRIAVQLDSTGRGGSALIHEQWRAGQIVEILPPRNNFPLNADAPSTILIAGGIGITPMLSMIATLQRLNKPWRLHYAVRTRERAAFLRELEGYDAVYVTVDDEPSTPRLDMSKLLSSAPPDAHVYCCGPKGMLEAFRTYGAHLGDRLHFEYFSAEADAATDGGYRLELRRTCKTVDVQPGETMLNALINAGIDVPFACSEGICGTCRVQVIDGLPDHRDHFLTPQEQRENAAVMVCCSGARTATLVLDL